ncbi:uncharacterized protein MKZ38_008605 [Zalerion maritima]|uniref:glutamate--tRNA ligase n=1 Tax=Zalerion maritima TaxID=339359 RepID=A0AAD5RZN4_9PEZI|nr:uncharacterized protein MKZ38_008605 [Zalerion maritima]
MNDVDISRFVGELAKPDFKSIEPLLLELDRFLTLRTYLSGYSIGDSDKKIWTALRLNRAATGTLRNGLMVNISRWFHYIEAAHPEIQGEVKAMQGAEAAKKSAASKAGGNYSIGLKGTENGVVTRFPPEPSGYLHIGHAKAAFLNDYFAHTHYKGTLLLRFDDTNPIKEKEEYQDSIVDDLKTLGIVPDKTSYTSDYFDYLFEQCIEMIKQGKAYADDSDGAAMKAQRDAREPSPRRDRPADESLALLEEMKCGTESGKKHSIRAKIDYAAPNGTLRDPVIYRYAKDPNSTDDNIMPAPPHHRTGSTWKIYPTYDFACPLIDALEGVTHALRTTEYNDRNPQYQWFIKALSLRSVQVWEYARINFIRTFLSKRKLTKVVDTGRVTGWDDPRMPTVRGIVRRGLQPDVLRDFMLKQGPSRNITTMDWTTIWAMNKKALDPVVPRHTAIEIPGMVKATLSGGPEKVYLEDRPKHPKNKDVGTKKWVFSSNLLFDQVDAAGFAQDEEITLMTWGNAILRSVVKDDAGEITTLGLDANLDGDFRKTKQKITWLAEDGPDPLVKVELWEFDDLLHKDTLEDGDVLEDCLNPITSKVVEALVDANFADVKQGQVIQLERKGYYRVDKAKGEGPDGKAVLFKIPTGQK